jgi:hypothetical protein
MQLRLRKPNPMFLIPVDEDEAKLLERLLGEELKELKEAIKSADEDSRRRLYEHLRSQCKKLLEKITAGRTPLEPIPRMRASRFEQLTFDEYLMIERATERPNPEEDRERRIIQLIIWAILTGMTAQEEDGYEGR